MDIDVPDRKEYQLLIGALPFGKSLPNARYLHICATSDLPDDYAQLIEKARRIAEIEQEAFNVVKFEVNSPKISLLSYPGFFEDGFPALAESWSVDLVSGVVAARSYTEGPNPPILHRKEALLPSGHPLRGKFQALTSQAEAAGLLESTQGIGTRKAWEARLSRVRLAVRGNSLVDVGEEPEETEEDIRRYRTALVRYSLSSPMQQLWRFGFLDGENSVFDYGCGRGDDIRALAAREMDVSGWDPYFVPENAKKQADVVNLGFVLNVIEDETERAEALLGAWALTKKLMVVGVITGSGSVYQKFRLYRDGVITRRGTFQKYYSQRELRDYIGELLGRSSLAISPGIFFVFRDEEEEQKFRASRQVARLPRSVVPRAPRIKRKKRPRLPTKWEVHRDLFEAFWARCVELGRMPHADEFGRIAELLSELAPIKTVYRRCLEEYGEDEIIEAAEERKKDRLVYLALNLFENQRGLKKLPGPVQRDIRPFWGSYKNAEIEAQRLLFTLGEAEVVYAACADATARGLGYLKEDRAFFLHSSVINELSPTLRLYLGCAAIVYGDFESADLIKVHIGSRKVSLMEYDDFEGKAVPLLVDRTKIILGAADYDTFHYGDEYEPSPLYEKSRYLPLGFPRRDEQANFDEELRKELDMDLENLGREASDFQLVLDDLGLEIRGFRLLQKTRPKELATVNQAAPRSDAGAVEPGEGEVPGYSVASSEEKLCERTSLSPSSKGPSQAAQKGVEMTILEAVVAVLKSSDRALTAVEIQDAITKEGIFEFKAKDPKGVISSTIGKYLRTAGPHQIGKSEKGSFKSI